MPKESLAKYFSCNPEKGVVSRFGSGSASRANQFIGARRDAKDPTKLVFDPAEVVMIPAAECAKYRKEYARAVADGALVVKTAGDFAAYQKTLSPASAAPKVQAAEKKSAPKE